MDKDNNNDDDEGFGNEPMTAYEMTRMEVDDIPLGIDVLKVEGRKGLKDPKKAFYVALDTFVQRLKDEDVKVVQREERQDIASLIDYVPHVEFTNAKAFVLGYLTTLPAPAVRSTTIAGINVDELKRLGNFVDANPDLFVKKEDIVRYARLVMNARAKRSTHRLHLLSI